MDLKEIYTTLFMVSLLIFSFMSFALTFQNDNNAPEKLLDNPLINQTYNELYGNLSANQQKAQKSSDVFGNFTPNENLGVWEVTPIVASTRGLKALATGVYNILIKLPMTVLGVSPIVAAVFSGIFLFMLIIGVWGLWKGVFKI
jgi:hypothetical protein